MGQLWQQAADCAAQALLWRQVACLADGVHEAFGEVDARMAPAEFAVNVAQVAAEEVVDAGGEEQDGARLFGQVCEDVCDACEDELLVVAAREVGFAQFNRRESTHEPHLGGCQGDAAQAACGADEDLVCFGNEHARVDDVPGAAAGR